MAELNNTENKLGLLNIIVIILSIYVLGALIVDAVFVLPTETSILLTVQFAHFSFLNFQYDSRTQKAN